jgi:putative phosphoesterase
VARRRPDPLRVYARRAMVTPMARGKSPTSAPSLAKQRAELRLPASGSCRIVAVADTHGAPHPRAHGLIAALAPHAVLHAGDIGDLAVLDGLREIAPLFVVRGNIDARAADLPDALTVDVGAGEGALLSILVLHIGVLGPRLRADAARLARDEGAGVVVCGHSHVPFIGMDRGLAVFNPGSVGPRRFRLPIVFGVMELGPSGIRLHHVDCETGERWQP